MLALRNCYSRFLSRPKLNLFPLHVDWLLICKSVTSKRILLNTLSSYWPFPLHCQKKKSLFSHWLTAMLILVIAFLLASRGSTPSLACKLSSICSNLNDLSYLYLPLMAAAFQYNLAVIYFAFAVFPNCFHRSPETFWSHTWGCCNRLHSSVTRQHFPSLPPPLAKVLTFPSPPLFSTVTVYSLISPLSLIVSFLCCSRIYSYRIFS